MKYYEILRGNYKILIDKQTHEFYLRINGIKYYYYFPHGVSVNAVNKQYWKQFGMRYLKDIDNDKYIIINDLFLKELEDCGCSLCSYIYGEANHIQKTGYSFLENKPFQPIIKEDNGL